VIIYLKSKEEIEGFREAGRISHKILGLIFEEIKPGITTNFLNEVAMEECKKNNVSPTFLGYHGFPAAICTSVNDILVHGIPSDYSLKEGDLITVDLGVTLDGFIGDIAQTLVVGEGILENIDLLRQCNFTLVHSIGYAKPGNKLSDICKDILHCAKSGGYNVPMNYGGHGIDKYKLHAYPFIPCHTERLEDVTLRPGMVLAVEPMLINGKGTTKTLDDKWTVQTDGMSAHFEATILVTDGEVEILTQGEKQ